MHPKKLSKKLNDYDGYLLCYKPDAELNSGSNSHKILEYLSFGKVLIANKVGSYQNNKDIILMAEREDNSDYVKLFNSAIEKLDELNAEVSIKKRRNFALANTYSNQLMRIEELIGKSLKN